MSQVRFAKWWRVALGPTDRAMPIAKLANGDPLLLEMPYKKGRVILCTVPLDRRWGSTWPSAVEFPILMHELAAYLAGSRAASRMLRTERRSAWMARRSIGSPADAGVASKQH